MIFKTVPLPKTGSDIMLELWGKKPKKRQVTFKGEAKEAFAKVEIVGSSPLSVLWREHLSIKKQPHG